MNCKHNNQTFLSIVEKRGFPEKLFVCEDCGVVIFDFASPKDQLNIATRIPSVSLDVFHDSYEQSSIHL